MAQNSDPQRQPGTTDMDRGLSGLLRRVGSAPSITGYLVWGVWASMFFGGLLFITTFGSNVPYWDDWNMVSVLVGDQPINSEWLWSEHNGHRIPLPRLVLLALYRLSGDDFRVGMYFNILVLGAISFAMICVAKAKRGQQTLSDGFFPLLMLSWGHYENLLWSWQVTQVIPVVIVSALLLVIVIDGCHLSFPRAIAVGLLVLLLPLCGVPGLVYVPAFAMWLTFVAHTFRSSTEPHGNYRGLILLGFVIAAVSEIGLYLVGYQEAGRHVVQFDLRESLRTSVQFLTSGFGPGGERFWPYSGWAMLLVLLFTVAVLFLEVWRKGVSNASHARGLICFLVAVGTLALSVGLGRQGFGFTGRYFLIATPGLCCVYYAWAIVKRSFVSSAVPVLLFVLVALLTPINARAGLDYGRDYSNRMESFRRDLLVGAPVSALLARHASALCPCPFSGEPTWGIKVDENKIPAHFPPKITCVAFHTWLGKLLGALHRQRISYFEYLEERDEFREMHLEINALTKNSDTTILFDEPRFLYGVRISYKGEFSATSRPPCLQIFWKKKNQTSFAGEQRYIHYWLPGEREETLWIYDRIDELVFNLDNRPDPFDTLDIAFLVP
jgi:hypothetical protein